MASSQPYSVPLDLGTLSNQPVEVKLKPGDAERAAIAKWLGIGALESFVATVQVSRSQTDRYAYDARFEADVVQACVVTLEPVNSHLNGEFSRNFLIGPKLPARLGPVIKSHEVSTLADDEPEVLSSPFVDLAGPVLEELSLALDPYPRVPGVAFEVQGREEPPAASPFAVLESLKQNRKSSTESAAKRPNKRKNRDR
jgi:uncharacterized metal-binding protein YceD (DUF177 family)